MLQGGVLLLGLVVMTVNLLVDLTYGIITPRIRRAASNADVFERISSEAQEEPMKEHIVAWGSVLALGIGLSLTGLPRRGPARRRR